jgi:hypothetical protein
MTQHSDSLSAKWLMPMVDLIQNREFGEAYALAEYYPATTGRKLVQCAALLGENELERANELLKTSSLEMESIAMDFTGIWSHDDPDLLEVSQRAAKMQSFLLARLCIEAHLVIHPEISQEAIEAILFLVMTSLRTDQLDVGIAALERLAQIDDSPLTLLRCAHVALANRQPDSAEALSETSRRMLDRAVNKLPKEDIELKLKAAKLLSIEAKSFERACVLMREAYREDPSVKSSIHDLLMPLIEYKPYFSDIADFMLEIDPGSVATLSTTLMSVYYETQTPSYLEKVLNILEALDYLELGYAAQFATAVLAAADELSDLEAYAERLVEYLQTEPQLCLDIAQALYRNELESYELTAQLLRLSVKGNPKLRSEVLATYAQLVSRNRDQKGTYTQLILELISLSENFEEFADSAVRGKLSEKLLALDSRFAKN